MDHNADSPLQLPASSDSSVRVALHPGGLRLMRSHGQLARSWNEAITTGLVDLDNPQMDAVVTIQADAALEPTWWTAIEDVFRRSSCQLLTFGRGDEMLVYRPEAVRRIGLWDERFSGITNQEGDYYARARLHYPEGSCLHDVGHHRIFTPLEDWREVLSRILDTSKSRTGYERMLDRQGADPDRAKMQAMEARSWNLWRRKWRHLATTHPQLWQPLLEWKNVTYSPTASRPCPKPASPQEPLYTPFEDGITNRECIFAPNAWEVNRSAARIRAL